MAETTVASVRTDAPPQKVGLTLAALAVAGMVVSLQQTMIIPLLYRFMEIFHTTVTNVTWVFTASLLTGAVSTPLLSRFGDMYGKKKMIMVTMGLLIVGSVICALANSLSVMIAGRALQGTSAAMIPLAIGMVRDTFPREKVTSAIGIISAMMGVGGTIGMLVTGVIASHTQSPHPVFWTSAALAVIGAVMVAISAHDSGTRTGGRPDYVGAVLLAGWLVCLLLAISEGNAWGWTSAGVAGLFAAAAVVCAVWVVVELRVREPLVRLGLLVGTRSLSANLASMLLGFSMFAAFTLVSNFVQTPRHTVGYGLSGSVLDVGLYGIPSTVAMMVCSALAGRVEGRIGAAFTLAIGSAAAGVSYLWMAVSNAHVYDVVAFNVIQGIGFGIAYAALGTLAVQHVPMSQSGIASGINSLVRTTGGSVAGAITAAILTANTIGHSQVPSLHGYVLCFALLTAGAWLAAAVAVANGVRHRS